MPTFFTVSGLVARSKKWSKLLVLTLLARETAVAQHAPDSASGLGVFGNTLGIHGGDTLTVAGNVVILKQASVAGTGTLSLRSTKPQKLVAQHSRLKNLHIHNPTTVRLIGELTVEQGLTIERATVDARAGRLVFSDSSQLRLRAGGKLLASPDQLSARVPADPWPSSKLIPALLPAELNAPAAPVATRQDVVVQTVMARLINPSSATITPPPEYILAYRPERIDAIAARTGGYDKHTKAHNNQSSHKITS